MALLALLALRVYKRHLRRLATLAAAEALMAAKAAAYAAIANELIGVAMLDGAPPIADEAHRIARRDRIRQERRIRATVVRDALHAQLESRQAAALAAMGARREERRAWAARQKRLQPSSSAHANATSATSTRHGRRRVVAANFEKAVSTFEQSDGTRVTSGDGCTREGRTHASETLVASHGGAKLTRSRTRVLVHFWKEEERATRPAVARLPIRRRAYEHYGGESRRHHLDRLAEERARRQQALTRIEEARQVRLQREYDATHAQAGCGGPQRSWRPGWTTRRGACEPPPPWKRSRVARDREALQHGGPSDAAPRAIQPPGPAEHSPCVAPSAHLARCDRSNASAAAPGNATAPMTKWLSWLPALPVPLRADASPPSLRAPEPESSRRQHVTALGSAIKHVARRERERRRLDGRGDEHLIESCEATLARADRRRRAATAPAQSARTAPSPAASDGLGWWLGSLWAQPTAAGNSGACGRPDDLEASRVNEPEPMGVGAGIKLKDRIQRFEAQTAPTRSTPRSVGKLAVCRV